MSHRIFPDESKTWMKLIFLEYPTFFGVTFQFRRRIANHRISKRKSITRNWMNNKQRDVGGAFFNRWLVVDVPPGWQLVSQVLLALHITLLRGESLVVLAESAVLSRCIILFTMRRVPNFSPAWLLASHKKQLPLTTTNITFHFHLSLILSVFLSLSEGCSNIDRSH